MVTRFADTLRYASAGGDVWSTPPEFFAAVDRVCNFGLDAAANEDNALCARYWTEEDDGLSQEWKGRVWCNPPYSQVRYWTRKAADEFECGNADLVVMLVPVRTSTRWWRNAVASGARVVFVPNRLYFTSDKGVTGRAGFDSALLCWGVTLQLGKCESCKGWAVSSRSHTRTCSAKCRKALSRR